MSAAAAAAAAGAGAAGAAGAARDHSGLLPVTVPFITSPWWYPKKCWKALQEALRLDGWNIYIQAVRAYRAWQLVRFCGYSPEGALLFVKQLEGYCLSSTDGLSPFPHFPPPVGYDGCRKCWGKLNYAEKRSTWLPFWIGTGQVKFTNSDGGGGGGGGADTPAAGDGPAGAK